MEEEIKILEKFINGTLFKYARNAFDEEDLRNTLDKAIENLIKGYRELEKEVDSLVRQYEYQGAIMVSEYMSLSQIKKLFIPKSKIREKIEELEKEKVDYQCKKNAQLVYGQKVLQELMEEEKI